MSTNGGERFTGEILRTMPLCQIFKACTVSLNSFANLSNLSIMASLDGLAVCQATGQPSSIASSSCVCSFRKSGVGNGFPGPTVDGCRQPGPTVAGVGNDTLNRVLNRHG